MFQCWVCPYNCNYRACHWKRMAPQYMTLEWGSCMCEKKWKLHNDSLGLSRVHKSATVAAVKPHRVSLSHLCARPLIDTCPQSKHDLPHFCTLFPLSLISVTPEHYWGGGRGASSKTRISITAQQERENEGV